MRLWLTVILTTLLDWVAKRKGNKDAPPDETIIEVTYVERLSPAALKRLEQHLGPMYVTPTTTATQVATMLGEQRVMERLRNGV